MNETDIGYIKYIYCLFSVITFTIETVAVFDLSIVESTHVINRRLDAGHSLRHVSR